jgi:hypothetical protein
MTDRRPLESLPDWQLADTLPDWVSSSIVADGVTDPNTMRGMGHGPVNPPQVNDMGGLVIDDDAEFVVNRLASSRPNQQGKTSDALGITEHRGNQRQDTTASDNRRLDERQADGHR